MELTTICKLYCNLCSPNWHILKMGTALAENIDPSMCSWTTFKRPNVRSLSQFQPQPNAYVLPSRCWHRYPARSYTAQKTSAFNWIKKRRGVTLKNAKSWKDIALPIHHRKRSSFQWFQTPFLGSQGLPCWQKITKWAAVKFWPDGGLNIQQSAVPVFWYWKSMTILSWTN